MNVLTVSQLNTYVKATLDENKLLKNVFVCGEISNFVNYQRSGHFYFTLKDNTCQIKSVMFSHYNERIKFEPSNGMSVICRGRVSLFERDGNYQFYVEDMQPDGYGALNLAYEQMKEKLAAKGYFDDELKKPIPKRPQKIGVITSNMGAALHDICNVLERRFPLAEVVLCPVAVQGNGAAEQIAAAIDLFNARGAADVLIVGRGGGSLEDLWAFNTEIVAMSVVNSNIPVVSAVGHETDFTICDFVADLRAPTPSAAAELVVPDAAAELSLVDALMNTVRSKVVSRLDTERLRLDSLANQAALRDFNRVFLNSKETLQSLNEALLAAISSNLQAKRQEFLKQCALLDSLSPLAVLARGYAIASDKNNNLLTSHKQISKGDEINIRLADGTLGCTVERTEK